MKKAKFFQLALTHYEYDALECPITRSTSRNGTTQNDTFGYNPRSERVSATLGNDDYSYAFDNIGNRETTTEAGTALNYTTNNLNQYTEIIPSESSASFAFNPVYDADGNATQIPKDGNRVTYGYDITKNVCEVFVPAGHIRTVIAGEWEDSGAGCCPGKENK